MLKQRIERLEKLGGGESERHVLLVPVADGQSDEDAFESALIERGIEREDVGFAVFFGATRHHAEDFGGYEDLSELRGYAEVARMMRKVFEEPTWRSSIRGIIQRRRKLAAEGKLEQFYAEMPSMRPPSA